jgi:hypothetical protein
MRHLSANPLILAALSASFLVVAAGCQSSPSGNAAAKAGTTPLANAGDFRQLIVKFKSATFDCNSSDISRLAAQTGTRLEFVRPMSGDACVIRQIRGSTDDYLRERKLLQQHPSIEWVGPDAIMKTM